MVCNKKSPLANRLLFIGILIYRISLGASATDMISATVVIPIATTSEAELSFGQIKPGTKAGTVVISAEGTRVATGGVKLTKKSMATPGALSVRSQERTNYTITLPRSAITPTDGGANTLVVDNWTVHRSLDPSRGDDPTELINIGATVHIKGAQKLGQYSGSFKVSIDYY